MSVVSRTQALDSPQSDQQYNATDGVLVQRFSVAYEYPVHFTEGVFDKDNPLLKEVLDGRSDPGMKRVLIVVDEGLVKAMPSIIDAIKQYAQAHHPGIELVADPLIIPAGEPLKSDKTALARLYRDVAACKLDRHAYLIGVGGGALLDAVGLVAATAHRGIRHIRVPSTVLAQNDSGVGVKNGINLFGQKNYLGTFSPPFAVINDHRFIDVLPERDRIAGMAEAVKVALIRDQAFFIWLENNAGALRKFDRAAMRYMIKRCAELHLHQIAHGGDPFESGNARPLDFGHWAAHKLETLSAFNLRHGEAVAIGIMLDTRYSVLNGLLEAGADKRVYTLLQALGFRLWHPSLLCANAEDQLRLLYGLEEFREHLGGQLTITLLSAIGTGIEVHSMDPVKLCQSIAWLKQRHDALVTKHSAIAITANTHTRVVKLAKRRQRPVKIKKIPKQHSVPARPPTQSTDAENRAAKSAVPTAFTENTSLSAGPVNMQASSRFLQQLLEKQLSDSQFDWFSTQLKKVEKNRSKRDLLIFLGLIPRKLGRADLRVTPTEIIKAQSQAGVAWNPYHWTIDNAARCVVLLNLLEQRPDDFDELFGELCRNADLSEQITYYRCTAIFRQSEPLDNIVSQGLRTHITAVFDSIAHHNPYPFMHFDENRWNHMVLKALFVDSPLWPIYGLDQKVNLRLAQTLCDYAHERWSAGRPVSPELWRCVGPMARDSMLDDLYKTLNSKDEIESQAALMALLTCPLADRKSIRARHPEVCRQIDQGVLNWEVLGRRVSQSQIKSQN